MNDTQIQGYTNKATDLDNIQTKAHKHARVKKFFTVSSKRFYR